MAALLDELKKGSTSRSVTIRIIDSTDGTPETGVVFNTSGIDLWYRRQDAFVVSITEADLSTPDLEDTWETGGFLHIKDGEYRLDVPDLAFATGANHVDIGGTVTGMVVISTSHIGIHTWPLRNRFSMDVFSCREYNEDDVQTFLKERMNVKKRSSHWIRRVWP